MHVYDCPTLLLHFLFTHPCKQLPLGYALGLRVNKQQHIVCPQESESWEEAHVGFGSGLGAIYAWNSRPSKSRSTPGGHFVVLSLKCCGKIISNLEFLYQPTCYSVKVK